MNKRESFLSLAIPDISQEEIFEVIDSLKSGWISVGPKVKAFEQEIANYHNVKHAIATSSCTTALFLVAKLIGVKKGDYVIVPTITWQTTANIVEQLEAIPLFTDVEKDTSNMKLEDVLMYIKKYGKKIKAIIPVHMSGLPVDIDKYTEISEQYNIPIIYDAAHAIYSSYKGKMIGGYGVASTFSFYATKNITTGDGGVITTNDDKLAEEIRVWAYHGLPKDSWKRYSEENASPHVECIVPGYKFNLTDIQAAIGVAQLRRRDYFISKRNDLFCYYNELFKNLDYIQRPLLETEFGKWGNHVYAIKFLDDNIDRNKFMVEMRKNNIGTNIHFYPVHLNHFYRKKYPEVSLPNSEWLKDRLLTIPLCTKYCKNDLEYVFESIKYIYEKGLAIKD